MNKLIVFICNGNIHRSVIAAESLKKILKERKIGAGFLVDSYGLQGTKGTELPKHKHLSEYLKEWEAAKSTLRKLNIDISKHSFQKISGTIMKKASVVIAMDSKVYSTAKNSLINQFPNYAWKIHRFSELTTRHRAIKDPAGSSDEMLHKKIIKNIYFTLNKKYENILGWTK
ncbi:MAG: hypothetical protein ACD_76C00044G0027 [uncultured bacterium]|nr:MAG: hypothetical protein ACD_76C00044G0027 [uncultured bacterium]HBD05202.1 hypothetical protein [Candidatus Uhrbacteria bacterium]